MWRQGFKPILAWWGYLRPLLVTSLAAAAFALLLHWHHGRFQDEMIRSFQTHQEESAFQLARAVEADAADMVGSLRVLRAYPAIRERTSAAQAVLDAYLRAHQDVLDAVALVGPGGDAVCASGLDAAQVRLVPVPALPSPGRPDVASFEDHHNVLEVTMSAGEASGDRIWCRTRLPSLLARSLHTSQDKRLCWIVAPDGSVLHGPAATGRTGALLACDCPLVSAMTNQAVTQGRRGTVEIHRSEGAVLAAYAPMIIGDARYALAIGSTKSSISVPLGAHERTTYALIAALALLYFATGFVSYRSEHARVELEMRKRTQAELVCRAKTDFLARMSHEIRTPLAGVLGMLDLAVREGGGTQRDRYMDIAKRSADSLLRVVNDILDLSKIEAGKLEVIRTPFDIRSCLADTLEPLRYQAQQKGLTLTWTTDFAVPLRLVGDPGRTRQVLSNLVNNAIKFTAGGSVSVCTTVEELSGASVRLRVDVADTGPGIAPDKQQTIFQPFEQTCVGLRDAKSTGLGLTISRQLVEMMGGRIWVDSEEGSGSIFHFTLTLLVPSPWAGPRQDEPVRLRGKRVLVVCACPLTAAHIERTLASQGLRVSAAANAAQAIREVQQAHQANQPFDLLLTHAELPDGTGMDLARQVHEVQTPRPALMLLSPAGGRGDAAECGRYGIAGYISDLDPCLIIQAVATVLAGPDARAGTELTTRHRLRETPSLRILVAEDNPVNQEYVRTLLEGWNHRVRCVCDGQEAVQAHAEERFDLVLMDLQMPRMDGFEATAAIRSRESGQTRTPILAMTADVLAATRERCLQAQMDGCVGKPLGEDQLREVLATASCSGEPPGPPESSSPSPAGERAKSARVRPAVPRRFADDLPLFVRLARSFQSTASDCLTEINMAVGRRDLATVARLAHNLKSSLGLFEADEAMEVALYLERAARQDRLEDVQTLCSLLAKETNLLRGALAALVKEMNDEDSDR